MLANLLSFMIARRYQPVPVYHALLQQDHIHLPLVETRVPSPALTARELMGLDLDHIMRSMGRLRTADANR